MPPPSMSATWHQEASRNKTSCSVVRDTHQHVGVTPRLKSGSRWQGHCLNSSEEEGEVQLSAQNCRARQVQLIWTQAELCTRPLAIHVSLPWLLQGSGFPLFLATGLFWPKLGPGKG